MRSTGTGLPMMEGYVSVRVTSTELSEWECELFGMGRNWVFMPAVGQEPNWFWRWMQYLAFGNRWVRRKR